MEIEKKRAFLIRILYAAVILAITIYLCRKAVLVVLPFVIALLVSLLLKPLVRFLREKCRVQKNVAALFVVLLFYAMVGVLLAFLGIKLVATVKDIVLGLPEYYNTRIEPLLFAIGSALQDFVARLDPSAASTVSTYLQNAGASIESSISSFSMSALKTVTGYAFSVPGYLLNMLITIIATVFITMDFPLLKRFVLYQLSDHNRAFVHDVRIHLSRTLGRYVRSYALILSITFAELALGLSIIRVGNPLLLAFLIALFDILPVVGSGTVLIPWAILSAVSGDFRQAISIGILYVVITVIRNIIEPKIIGEHVGLHPIVTLLSMVVGVYVFGAIGLLGFPVTLALCKSLNDAGVIHLYRDPPPETADGGPASPVQHAQTPDPVPGSAPEPADADASLEEPHA